jgi:hypothetical protein
VRGLVLWLFSGFSPGCCVALCFGSAASADGGLSLGEGTRGAPTKSLVVPGSPVEREQASVGRQARFTSPLAVAQSVAVRTRFVGLAWG